MSVSERESRVLRDLHGKTVIRMETQGAAVQWGGWSEARAKGRTLRSAGRPRQDCLTHWRKDVRTRVAMYELVPGPRVFTAGHRLLITFSAMASAAWSVGEHMGVGPQSQQEAEYDLLCILALWSRKIKPASVTSMVRNALRTTVTSGSFPGRQVIQQLLQSGALRLSRRAFGQTGGTLAGLALVEAIEALSKETWSLLREEATAAFADGMVPIVARIRGVQKAQDRVESFYRVAEAYYTAKLG